MNKTLLYVLLIIAITGCQNRPKTTDHLFQGELFIKLIRSSFDLVTEKGTDGHSIIDVINSKNIAELSTEEIQIQDQFKALSEKGLLFNPTFKFIDDGKVYTVYISESDYGQISKFRFAELQRQNKKVKISFYGYRLNEHVLVCNQLKAVELVRGEQQWKK